MTPKKIKYRYKSEIGGQNLLGRRRADADPTPTRRRPNSNFRTRGQFSARGGVDRPRYPHVKRQIFVTKVEAICVIFGRFPPKFWEILLSGLPRILCKWGKSMAFMNNKYSIL